MRFLANIVSYIYIAIAFLTSLFSWGEGEMMPFRNIYDLPSALPEYQTLSCDEKSDWQAKWIWNKDDLEEKNTWTCFVKRVNVESVPQNLVAHISADSKYWLYINGQNNTLITVNLRSFVYEIRISDCT